MIDALKHLGESNIQGLVLDLRDNPGGLLMEGIDVAGHFLKKNEIVVSQRGRAQPNKAYTADNGGTAIKYPVVVVVDRMTASAAEIVSGALQDHDRAWILGETTFGKGLGANRFPAERVAPASALTTAYHYYTPSYSPDPQREIILEHLVARHTYHYPTNLELKNTQDGEDD